MNTKPVTGTLKGATKSKTMYLAYALAALVPALENLPALKNVLADNYGIALMSLSIIVGVLRALTTAPLREK
jgi:hypothetical protein